ncbi:thioredoxin fold domain-containing protein [Mesonia sp. K4-1]|jgi:thioredoxin-related protein|uniref:thioredoxin family protein n=1 Tax=Mesonia sp. K4-1 TaxID=2602760 RepID=UPI0011C71DA2|nr:thioredoxin fold domain-containing protein [Mesonia sp. K4-1]TXK78933.1 thioredoxin fold domain-containing protein [Mesonia sp. K4-1]
MKKILIIATVLISAVTTAQEIKWMSMNEALEAQKENPKKIFMDVYTDWCGPCKLLDKKTFANKDVANYVNKHFYAVKFNAEGTEKVDYQDFTYTNPNYKEGRKGRNSQHLFAHALKINAYPSMVFFDEEGNSLPTVTGYKTPQQLELYLKMIAKDDYKDITTTEAWQEYQSNFKGTFKN